MITRHGRRTLILLFVVLVLLMSALRTYRKTPIPLPTVVEHPQAALDPPTWNERPHTSTSGAGQTAPSYHDIDTAEIPSDFAPGHPDTVTAESPPDSALHDPDTVAVEDSTDSAFHYPDTVAAEDSPGSGRSYLDSVAIDGTTTTQTLPSSTFAETIASPTNSDCLHFTRSNDILYIFKTGATEAHEKLPVHFVTTMSCTDDYLLFSDMDQHMGQYHIHDALDEITPNTLAIAADDFRLYYDQKEAYDNHKTLRGLFQNNNAWNLDKYKFTPMLAKTWRMRPNYQWYVFLEADSYLVQRNLGPFLSRYDGWTEPLYIGSDAWVGDVEFAHGGSGYFISHAAMQASVGQDPEFGQRYENHAREGCCGDTTLAYALRESGIYLTNARPAIQGEPPATIDFNDGHWCDEILTMHHVIPEDVEFMWELEKARARANNTNPITYKDIYDHFFKYWVAETRTDWDNGSDNLQFDAFDRSSWGGLVEEETPPAEENNEGNNEEGKSEEENRAESETPDQAVEQDTEDKGQDESLPRRLGRRQLDPSAQGDEFSSVDQQAINPESTNDEDLSGKSPSSDQVEAPSDESQDTGSPDRENIREEDEEFKPWNSAETCRQTCLADEYCLQYVWHREHCGLHRSLRLGGRHHSDSWDDDPWVSGWMVGGRLEAYLAQLGDCSGEQS